MLGITTRLTASSALIALVFVCLLWELVWAPIRPGGSLLMLKALPLLIPLRGVLAGRVYTYQWALLLVLFYFCEGVVRAWSERGDSRLLALIETGLTVAFFVSALSFVVASRKSAS
jgi:uncharacterized membrane protein